MPTPENAAYQQPQLGLEAEPLQEITLEELLVTHRPTYTKLPNGQHEWRCRMAGKSDLFHLDRNEIIEASTIEFAEQAKSIGLRKSELVTSLTGRITQQLDLELVGGGKQTVYHIQVTQLAMPGRSPQNGAGLLFAAPSSDHVLES